MVRRALDGPNQADALLFEALPQLVEEERLVFRRRWSEAVAQRLDRAIVDGQIADQPTQLVGTAVTGAVVESLLPRLHASTATEAIAAQPVENFIAALQNLCHRLVGVPATTTEK